MSTFSVSGPKILSHIMPRSADDDTVHTVESFNSVENCFFLFRMCCFRIYKSVPVFSIPAFTECLNVAARYKTLLHDTVGTSDYMDPAGQGQEEEEPN